MRALIQRVGNASVETSGKVIGIIEVGLLVFLAIHKDDTDDCITKMADKVLNLRIFSDSDPSTGSGQGKMNLSVRDIKAEILVVSQFTLYGNVQKGNRPSFIESAKPEKAIPMYEKFVEYIRERGAKVSTGEFGASMEVKLVNKGPVSIIIDI